MYGCNHSVGADRFYDEEKNSAGDMNVYNTSKNVLKSWTMNPGVDRGYPRAMYYGWGSNSIITDRYVHDASFMRLSALNISYRLPRRLFGSSIVTRRETLARLTVHFIIWVLITALTRQPEPTIWE